MTDSVVNMKTNIFSNVFFVCMFSANCFSAAPSSSGSIEVNGNITASTCTVNVNNQTNPTLNLGTVNTTDLAFSGSTGPATNFTLNLTSCSATVSIASVTFEGNADAAMSSAFKNEATTNAANNVGVQIYDSNSMALKPNISFNISNFINVANASASVPFSARMIAVDDTATAGNFVSHADYTVSYQ